MRTGTGERCALWALGALVALPVLGGPVTAGSRLELVDDRDRPITTSVQACFQVGLESHCVSGDAGRAIEAPAGFDSVRIEGEDHGPAVLGRQGLKAGTDGVLRGKVSRKALLQVRGVIPQGKVITVSLYDPRDATFRLPAARSLFTGSDLKIPAGPWVASLSAPAVASDGTGHLVVAGIAPGSYDLFLATLSSESTIAAGLEQGYLTSATVAPLTTAELQLTVRGAGQ